MTARCPVPGCKKPIGPSGILCRDQDRAEKPRHSAASAPLPLSPAARAALAEMPEDFDPQAPAEDLAEHFAEAARLRIARP